MKQLKYLNMVLTVIATCLIIITLVLTHAFPTANAQTRNFDKIKVLDDGSIVVRLYQDYKTTPIKVNIDEVSGFRIGKSVVPVVVIEDKKP